MTDERVESDCRRVGEKRLIAYSLSGAVVPFGVGETEKKELSPIVTISRGVVVAYSDSVTVSD